MRKIIAYVKSEISEVRRALWLAISWMLIAVGIRLTTQFYTSGGKPEYFAHWQRDLTLLIITTLVLWVLIAVLIYYINKMRPPSS